MAYTDPSGDYIPVFAFPTIGWSKEGGLSVGVTVGIGVPGIVSLQLSGEYAFKTNDYSITIGASVMYNTAYLSYSGSNGWSYGFSMGLTPGNSPISSSFSSAGFSWNLSNEYATINFLAWNYSEGNGWSFNPGFSITPVYYSRNKNGESSSSYFGKGIVERMKARRSLVQFASYLAENGGVSFDDLWNNYPSSHVLHLDKNGNDIFEGVHCAIDLSEALMKSGINLSGGTRCWGSCPSGGGHFIVAQQLANALNNGGYNVTRLKGNTFYDRISGKQGIVFFQDYWQRAGEHGRTGDHIDLWNGSYLKSSGWWGTRLRLNFPNMMERFGMSSLYQAKAVWFWEF